MKRHCAEPSAELIEHYHRERNHQGLRNQLIELCPSVRIDDNRILTRERAGWLAEGPLPTRRVIADR